MSEYCKKCRDYYWIHREEINNRRLNRSRKNKEETHVQKQ